MGTRIRACARLVVASLLLAVAGLALATGDTSLVFRGATQGKVVFDGRGHGAQGYVCNDCHTRFTNGAQLFETTRRARIGLADHTRDAQCFACHDGVKAGNDCATCHRGSRG